MSNLSLERLLFDRQAPGAHPQVGANIMGDYGSIITSHTQMTVTASNKFLDFSDSVPTTYAVSVAEGVYTPESLAVALAAAMNGTASGDTFTVTYDATTRKYTIASSSATFSILWNTGTNAANSIGLLMGFDVSADDTAQSNVSDNTVDLTVADEGLDVYLLNQSLDVRVISAPGLAIYQEDSVANSGDDGQSILLVREDTLAISTNADGDYGNFKGTNKGELYVKATDSDALLTTIDSSVSAMATDLAAIEILITASNALLTTIDADTSAILLDTNAMVVDLAAIEVLITSTNALLTTIDADTSAILLDTNAMVVDLAAIEVLLTGIDVDTDAIATSTASIDAILTAAADAQNRLKVNDAPNTAVEETAVSVGLTAVALPPTALTGRTRIMIQNKGNASIFIGKTGVTTANGIEVAKGATLSLEAGDAIALFAISTAAAQDVRVLELA